VTFGTSQFIKFFVELQSWIFNSPRTQLALRGIQNTREIFLWFSFYGMMIKYKSFLESKQNKKNVVLVFVEKIKNSFSIANGNHCRNFRNRLIINAIRASFFQTSQPLFRMWTIKVLKITSNNCLKSRP